MRKLVDVVVLGVGGVGSAACRQLAQRGWQVLGIEQFAAGHAAGSSHGETRIIRQAYFEHPHYVPLLKQAYELWQEIEQAAGLQLYYPTGLIISGTARGTAVPGAWRSAQEHQLTVEQMTAEEAAERFPWFHFPADHVVLYEPQAGYLRVEACVQACWQQARQSGAELWEHTPVVSWSPCGQGVEVVTTRGTIHAGQLIITAGAWARRVLSSVGVPLTIRRKFMGWFALSATADDWRRAPAYYFEDPAGSFYGFPSLDGFSLKLAEHTGGELVSDPNMVDRRCHEEDLTPLQQFAQTHLRGVTKDLVRYSVCLYTMSPDEHFIVDRHPQCSSAWFVAGLSGHGFKFTPVLGESLAQAVEVGKLPTLLQFLGLARFS
ncbi:MAG: N-methyltryptophan oxidase [Planctomycetaceae bacterium]|nr:MAG: N-methyltryptophan oxidase [Planctomycetaceae bacterium]